MTEPDKFTFLCGVVDKNEGLLSLGIIRLQNLFGSRELREIEVSQNDPGLKYIVAGRRRMVVTKNRKIIAVFGRPRIGLLAMLSSDKVVTEEHIYSFSPTYPKPEKVLRATRKWKGTQKEKYGENGSSVLANLFYRIYN